jgi:hypothetical protein
MTGFFAAGIAVYLLLSLDDRVLRNEDVRCIFDGSDFYKKAEGFTVKKEAQYKAVNNCVLERYRWIFNSLLAAAFFNFLLPYSVASLLAVKVKELVCKMQGIYKDGNCSAASWRNLHAYLGASVKVDGHALMTFPRHLLA